jgi:predicted GNAT family acetyltransferase
MYFDGVPVNMAWKRRPLTKGISVAYVYTPKEHRSKGYAATCVALLTEELLKSYEYVNLFALGSQNPEKNLYTTIGYQWCGEAGRLVVLP